MAKLAEGIIMDMLTRFIALTIGFALVQLFIQLGGKLNQKSFKSIKLIVRDIVTRPNILTDIYNIVYYIIKYSSLAAITLLALAGLIYLLVCYTVPTLLVLILLALI